MSRVAFVDPVGGVAGDMLLAALLDAGAPRSALDAALDALALEGVVVEVSAVRRGGVAATHVAVTTAQRRQARPAAALRAVVTQAAGLDRPVRERSLRVLDRLIAAEAAVHGVAPEDVVLHELGGDDTLVDICGVVALLAALGVERVVCGPLPLATGATVETAHGPSPTPAPATLALLEGLPVRGVDATVETVTPTGAALLATLAEPGPLPAMVLEATGAGAGTRDDPGVPNVVRVLLGAEQARQPGADEVVVLEANVDDLQPELVPDVLAACLAAGALDAWVQPILMKKGRPGFLLGVLARPEDRARLVEVVFRESSTLGVRIRMSQRAVADRATRDVEVAGHTVRVKLGIRDGDVLTISPEHDDCAAVAAATGRPVKQIWAEALAAATGALAPAADGSERDDAVPR